MQYSSSWARLTSQSHELCNKSMSCHILTKEAIHGVESKQQTILIHFRPYCRVAKSVLQDHTRVNGLMKLATSLHQDDSLRMQL